jgi:hypothetical protein
MNSYLNTKPLLFSFVLVILHGMATAAFAQYPGFNDPGTASAGGQSGAGLVPVEPDLDGGEIPTGATAQVVVRFRNDGTQPVQTGIIRLYPSSTVSATISMNQCEEEALPSGAECAIALSVKGLQAGPWRVEMLMSHSGRTRLVTATLSGSVETSSDAAQRLATDVEAIPNEIEFGTLTSSQTLVEPITLRNITSQPIDINDLYIDAGTQSGYNLKTECETLQPGEACIAVVSWSPQLSGRASGVMVVKHTGPTALTSVFLSGEYDPEDVDEAEVFPRAVPGKGLLVSSQTELDFGGDVENTSTLTVSLVNAGDAPIVLNDISLSGSDNGLSFKETGCDDGTVLEPIEACALTLTWTPSRVGSIFDDIQISHTGARGVLVLPVRGTSSAAVSKDQKAIVLTKPMTVSQVEDAISDPVTANQEASEDRARELNQAPPPTQRISYVQPNQDVSSVLDGYKITSFAGDRAIISGPGGSRIVFDQEEAVIGGVPWIVVIKDSGIEFLHQGQRILLLFDKSLSVINRSGSGSTTSSNSSDDDA